VYPIWGAPLYKQVSSGKERKLTAQDIAILEGLALHNPRNMSDLAAQLNVPRPSLRYRFKNLQSRFSLSLYGNTYHTFIGLRKAIVFADATPGYEELLYECLRTNEYWLYVSQCIGAFRCIAIYGIPAEREKEFEEFLGQLRDSGVVQNISFFWSTCIQTINATGSWFDRASEEWRFPWDLWVREIEANRGELPYTLREPDEYVQKADWFDIMILKELEKDSTIRLSEIAKKLGTSLERVMYHYKNHVVRKGMFEGYQVIADHYKNLFPEACFFQFYFKNCENLTKFASSLMYKPFARSMGKEYERNRLFAQIYLPKEQLRNFLDTISRLVRSGLIETYDYVIQDMARTVRQTISYELFKGRTWEYNGRKYAEKLWSTLKQFN
jgi:DNA-binding Lrp family transcriptional regulator